MDRISQLPDEILLRILSFLPLIHVAELGELFFFRGTNDAFVKTVAISLADGASTHFDYSLDEYLSYREFLRCVERYLLLHKAPTIDALRFKLGESWVSGDIQVWIKLVEKRSLRELVIKIDASNRTKTPVVELPS
ncbi:putative FBD-associated F-box protein [Raphanus sativus]|nr:putative FBD-associated F-box protein [Raphanus sativus]